MRSFDRRLPLLLLAALLPRCGGEAENPFASGSTVARLRPTAAVVFVSDAWAARPGGLREVFAVDEDGANLTRLTLCNVESRSCENLEVTAAPDRRRLAIRRVLRDSDGNGRLAAGDVEVLVIADTQRGTEGQIALRASSTGTSGFLTTDRLSGLDWSPAGDILVYSAFVEGSGHDLFRTVPRPDSDGTETRNLTFTSAVRERRPRIDPSGSVAAYERTDATSKSEIWIYNSPASQVRVTSGGEGSLAVGDIPVGGDSDPDYSPDGRSLVFRRLTGQGAGGLGSWDIYTIRTDRTALTLIATGPEYRSAPDWGPGGIVFSEIERPGGLARLVTVQPDGSGRRVIATLNGFDVQSPRWLPRP